ncbi:MAG TPA: BAX inhibitor (BI)-1/YccA family protein, partial [Alphaproteobacteria bacterium]|nr:BAX inhibitor (BI)-1/YccA family protein [Alphaproteobacteria bacterium]
MSPTQAAAAEIDVGLREYMLRVYNYMASGLALTGIIAYMSANTPAIMNLLYAPGPNGVIQPTMLAWIVMFSPLAFILALNFGINRMKASTMQAVFWGFSAVMGLSLSSIFLTYTGVSIARVFFITSGTFAGMSLYG